MSILSDVEMLLSKKKSEVEVLMHKLVECQYSGSMDGKIDINSVVRIITDYKLITDTLIKELKNLSEQIKKFSETKEV